MKNSRLTVLGLLALQAFLFGGTSSSAWADSPALPENNLYKPKPMDGVTIDAVEDYPNPLKNELGLGVGLYPFDSFYSGVLLNADYRLNMDRKNSWEILNLSYAFTFDKGVTTEMADKFGINPQVINRLDILASSNYMYTLADGKFVLLDNYIRYFRLQGLGGLGVATSTFTKSITVNAGARFEVFTSFKFSWLFDIRDMFALNGFDHFVTFTLGTGFSF